VGGVACLLELLGQGDIFQGEAVGLGSSDDGVLKAGVDLIPTKQKNTYQSVRDIHSFREICNFWVDENCL